MKGGKRAQQKMEQRLRDLEMELDAEQRRHGETTKNLRKQDRRLKELAFQGDEDRKLHDRLRDANEKLQQKIKAYKRQVEETVIERQLILYIGRIVEIILFDDVNLQKKNLLLKIYLIEQSYKILHRMTIDCWKRY